jgi:hypothetical protein
MVGNQELSQQPFGVFWHATHLGELSMLTVGEPLSTDPRVVVHTDTSQGGYRRLAVLDDRLVGYLALGSKQADSLAIKRIIDEGTPISKGIKPLLKGQFDARSYLSNQRSRATRNLLNTKAPLYNIEVVQRRPTTEELNYTGRRQPITDQLALNRYPMPTFQPNNHVEQYGNSPSANVTETPIYYYKDEINPFTGNLPAPMLPQPEPDRRRLSEPSQAPYTYANQTPKPNYQSLPTPNQQTQRYTLWTYGEQPDMQTVVPNIHEGEIL